MYDATIHNNIRWLYLFVIVIIFIFCGDTLTFNDNQYVATSGFIFSIDYSLMRLLNLKALKPSRGQELLPHWSICITVLHIIERSKMNGSLPDMTSTEIVLDPSLSRKK